MVFAKAYIQEKMTAFLRELRDFEDIKAQILTFMLLILSAWR